jgi:hypothetical protein
LVARVNPLGKNTTLGETLRHRVAPGRLAFSWDRGIILYMDTTTQSKQMKSTRAQQAVIDLLKKQLQTQKKELVRNSFFKVFDNLNNKLKQQLWIEAQI